VTTSDTDVSRGLLRVATAKCHPDHRRQAGTGSWWDRVRGAGALFRLVRDSGVIDVHVVRPETTETKPASRRSRSIASSLPRSSTSSPSAWLPVHHLERNPARRR